MANREALDFNMPFPGISKVLDAVWGVDYVQIKRTILELNKILTSLQIFALLAGQFETQIVQRRCQRAAVLRRFLDEQICILGGVRKPKKDGAGFSDKEILHAMACEGVFDFRCLAIFKRGHSRAMTASYCRTNRDTPSWS